MKHRLVVTPLVPDAVTARIRAEYDAVMADGASMDTEATLKAAAAHQAEALFITSTFKLTADSVARLPPTVKVVSTCSVGFEHMDVAAAKAHGLIVTNTPDVLTDATADMAFLLILNACRRAHEYDGIMRKGWGRAFGMGDMLGIDASGKTLGIFGMGRIGRAVAQRARGFNMKIVYHNKTRLPPELEQGATYYPTLNEMLPHCQILSVHAPAGPTTNKVMNAQTLGLLPKGAVFVNTARGTLVDEDALFDALKSGHLFAAGLDVFHNEPNADKRFATLENTFLVPHMGSATVETRKAMGDRALDNIAAVLAGRPPIDPLWV